jgi:hypothetical protein
MRHQRWQGCRQKFRVFFREADERTALVSHPPEALPYTILWILRGSPPVTGLPRAPRGSPDPGYRTEHM